MVHVLVRSNGGAKLPSVGLCLNASKAEARLDMETLLLGLLFVWGRNKNKTRRVRQRRRRKRRSRKKRRRSRRRQSRIVMRIDMRIDIFNLL